MKLGLGFLCCWLFLLYEILCQPIDLNINAGPIRGFSTSGSCSQGKSVPLAAFLGIPYAESTAGDARWTAPQPKKHWTEVLNASHFGDSCPGDSEARQERDGVVASENCLSVNIWTPKSALSENAKKLPVVVWIHGGGFMIGSSSDPIWHGNTWAAEEVVFVSLNYRLGALGFFASPSLDTVNFGILDQQLALRWVRDNIGIFGGDAGSVTIWGQSAGAMSVLVHMVSPQSKGLYHRAIANSPIGIHYRSWNESFPIMEDFSAMLLCNIEDIICLRKRHFKTIVKLQDIPNYAFYLFEHGFTNFLPWHPIVSTSHIGGLRDNPTALFKSDQFNHVPLLLGSVRNETDMFLPAALNMSWTTHELITLIYGKDNATRIEAAYRDISDPFEALGTVSTDSLANCYTRHVARIISDHYRSPQLTASVYLYQFLHAPTADPENANNYICTHGSTCHASDNTFCMGTLNNFPDLHFSDQEYTLSNSMVSAWSDFVKVDRMNQWSVYNASADESVRWLSDGPTTASGYHHDRCDLWDELWYQGQ